MPDYSEMHGWPRELYTLDGAAAERRVRCVWSERFAVALELDAELIYPYDSAGAILNKISTMPERNSKHEDIGGGLISYEHAILTANYSTIGPITVDLITEHLRPSVYGTKWSHRGLYWDEDGEDPLIDNEGPQRLHPTMTYDLQYYRLGAVPDSVYVLEGFINSNTVFTKILGAYILPTFLLYRGANVTRTQTAAGFTTFKVKHFCSYTFNADANGNGLGWNGVWNPETKAYALIYDVDGNQIFPYPSTTFNL